MFRMQGNDAQPLKVSFAAFKEGSPLLRDQVHSTVRVVIP